MMTNLKIASWNVCLGISNKLNHIQNILETESIDVLFVQEAEIQNQTNTQFYQINGFKLVTSETINTGKARSCCFIRNTIKFKQNKLKDNSIELISLRIGDLTVNGIYRPFKIPHHNNHREYMESLTSELKTIDKTGFTIIIGDFNLDSSKRMIQNYNQNTVYRILDEYLDEYNLNQIETNSTWSRIVQNSLHESTLDHIYTSDPTIIKNYSNTKQAISDHNLISINIKLLHEKNNSTKKVLVQDWSKYDGEVLRKKLEEILPHDMSQLNAQDHVSQLNQTFGKLIDEQVKTIIVKRKHIGEFLSIKMIKLRRKRNVLHKKYKKKRSESLLLRIKSLDKLIKSALREETKIKIRNHIKPGDSRTLWKAVKVARNEGFEDLPDAIMYQGILATNDEDKANLFSSFFDSKVKTIEDEVNITYDNLGERLIEDHEDIDLEMTVEEILGIFSQTSPKNCSGFDRIPMRMLIDCKEILALNICNLFNKIIRTGQIPDQWKVSKIIPLHKKGDVTEIENYRPISNICSLAKIFEKSILLKLSQIESKNNVDLTGAKQHGFKKNHSTITAMLEIQDLIGSAVDNGKYAAMISIDLSAAFDVVNHKRLFKSLKRMGIPQTLLMIIRNWLVNRKFYTEINGTCSTFTKIRCGTLQGSVLGPILFALFISPIYNICDMITYADDNYIISTDKNLVRAVTKVKMKAEAAITWLSQAGMKVNTNKTEFCVFSRNDVQIQTIELFGHRINSKRSITVLGVTFDSKMSWYPQVIGRLAACRSILFGLRIVRKYFNTDEFLQIVNAFFYSKLYYASQVWLIPSLNADIKKRLYSCSGHALKLVAGDDYSLFSFKELHCMFNRATPYQWSNYSNACTLYSIINYQKPLTIWSQLQDNFTINNRTDSFIFNKCNSTKVGLNCFKNRLSSISNQLYFGDFNMKKESFKIKCKRLFFV